MPGMLQVGEGPALLSPAQKAPEAGLGVGEERNVFHSKKGLSEVRSELGPWGQPSSGPNDVSKAFRSGEGQKPEVPLPPKARGLRAERGWRMRCVSYLGSTRHLESEG